MNTTPIKINQQVTGSSIKIRTACKMKPIAKVYRTDIFMYFDFNCTITIVPTRGFSSSLQISRPNHNIE